MTDTEALAKELLLDVARIVAEARVTTVAIIDGTKPEEAIQTVAREGFVAIYATLHKHLGVKP